MAFEVTRKKSQRMKEEPSGSNGFQCKADPAPGGELRYVYLFEGLGS